MQSGYRYSYVATHQKTQQGLKQQLAKIEYLRQIVATHQKTQQGLKQTGGIPPIRMMISRNASENPAGIETAEVYDRALHGESVATHQKTQQGLKHRNNPLIHPRSDEVATHQKTQQGLKHGNSSAVRGLSFSRNASENPAEIETTREGLPA